MILLLTTTSSQFDFPINSNWPNESSNSRPAVSRKHSSLLFAVLTQHFESDSDWSQTMSPLQLADICERCGTTWSDCFSITSQWNQSLFRSEKRYRHARRQQRPTPASLWCCQLSVCNCQLSWHPDTPDRVTQTGHLGEIYCLNCFRYSLLIDKYYNLILINNISHSTIFCTILQCYINVDYHFSQL